MSSNPLDSIYLLDYLHRAVPDIRVATSGADQFMLGRPRYVDFSGTLTISGLPIFSDHQVVSPEATQQVDFPDSSSEGVYLAVANLLTTDVNDHAPTDRVFYYSSAQKEVDNEDLKDCADAAVVGRSGFNLLSDRNEAGQHYPCHGPANVQVRRETTRDLRLPWAWVVALFLVAVATSLHVLLTLASHSKSKRLRVLRTGVYIVDPDRRVRSVKKFFYFALNNQLLLIEFMAVTATWGVLDLLKGRYQWVLFTANVALFSLTLAFFLKSLWDLRKEYGRKKNKELRSGLGVLTLISSLLFVPWTAWMWIELLRNGGTAQPWFAVDRAVALRSISLGDGVSPLASIAAILVAYALWALNNMRRLSFVETRRASISLPVEGESNAARLSRLCGKISENLLASFTMGPLIVGLTVITYSAIGLFRIWYGLRGVDQEVFRQWSWHRSLLRAWNLDAWNVDLLGFRTWMVVWGFGSLLVLVISSAGRIWDTWMALRRLTRELDQTPIRHVFDYVPKELSALQIWHIGGARQSLLLQSRTKDLLNLLPPSHETREQLALATVEPAGRASEFLRALIRALNGHTRPKDAHKDAAECPELLNEIREIIDKGDIPSYRQVGEMNRLLNCRMQEAAKCLTRKPEGDDALLGLIHKRKPLQELPVVEAAMPRPDLEELYVAYRFVALFRYTMLQIRNMLWFLVYGYTCLLLSIAVYPFQGRQSLGGLLSLVFLTLLVGVAVLMFQMDRDPILRRLDNPSGAVGNFLSVASNLIMVGGIPLLAVLASQFPSVADFFSSWVRPLAGALH